MGGQQPLYNRMKMRIGRHISGTLALLALSIPGVPDSAAAAAYWTSPDGPGCGYGAFDYFADNSTLDICFTGPSSSTDRDLVRTAIRDTWDAFTGLTMRWQGTCPDNVKDEAHKNWISIYLNTRAAGNMMEGTGAPGLGHRLTVKDCDESDKWKNRNDIQIHIGMCDKSSAGCTPGPGKCSGEHCATDWDSWLQAVAVHEFGHTLGFYHEHDRADSQDSDPPCEKPREVQPPSHPYLTEWDPVSVMSYCQFVHGRPATDWTLSDLDRLGAEMMYPFSTANHIIGCRSGCVTRGDGGAVVRSDGQVTSDWSMRGGYNIVPTWRIGTWSTTAESTQIPDSGMVSYSFQDVRGRANEGARTVIVSNELHTAVTLAAQAD